MVVQRTFQRVATRPRAHPIAWRVALPVVLAGAGAPAAVLEAQTADAPPSTPAAVDTTWGPAPAGFPAGARMQTFVGAPRDTGFFAVKIRLQPGDAVVPIACTRPVKLLVLEGGLLLGQGREANRRRARRMTSWDPAREVKAGEAVYGWARGATVLQIEGVGPLECPVVTD